MAMAAYTKLVLIMALLMAIAIGNVHNMANAQTLCRMTTEGLQSCMPSVGGSNPLPPSSACCAALSGADLPCLCSYKNSKLLPAYGINPQLALALPAKCNPTSKFHCS